MHARTLVPARPARTVEWPEWVSPPVYAAFSGAGVAAPWRHQLEAADAAHGGRARRRRHRHRVGQVAGLPAAGADRRPGRAGAAAGRGATALYLVPDQGAGPRPAARLRALAVLGLRVATHDGDTPPDERDWTRDHARVRPHQPRHAAPLAAAGARALGPVPAGAALRRRRRVPPLPRRLRRARRPGAAPAAAGLRALRRRPDVRAGLGHRRRPRRPRRAADRARRSRPSPTTARRGRR